MKTAHYLLVCGAFLGDAILSIATQERIKVEYRIDNCSKLPIKNSAAITEVATIRSKIRPKHLRPLCDFLDFFRLFVNLERL